MKGKVAVITGGNGTLGAAFTKGLAERGATVYVLGRDAEKSQKLKEALKNQHLEIQTLTCDVMDQQAVETTVQAVLKQAQRVDILINAAGGNHPGATVKPDQAFSDVSLEAFKQVTDLNLLGTVIPSMAFSKPMIAQGKGCIINISSMAAQLPLTRVVGYSASKAAVDNFTRWLAVEFASKYGEGIRVNAIAPGFFIADQNRRLLVNDDGSLTPRGETILNQTPAKRFGKPEELLSTLLWLCDDESSFVNGVIIPVDGGFSAYSGV